MTLRIALTSGEPAGVGPELCVAIAQRQLPCEVVCVADSELLATRARQIGLPLALLPYEAGAARQRGAFTICHIPVATASTAGRLDVRNARYVLGLLDRAIDGTLDGEF